MAESKFTVLCRIRPLSSSETQENSEEKVLMSDENIIRVKPGSFYTLDQVFDAKCSQKDVFNKSSKDSINEVFKGYNATIIAYGQTGSGKTYTIKGDLSDDQKLGIIPHSMKYIFSQIEQSKDTEFKVEVSYLEIYNDKITDLLDCNSTAKLRVYEDANRVPTVIGSKKEEVKDFYSSMNLFQRGESNRRYAATRLNKNSSRSHCILQVIITQKNLESHQELSGKLVLVDLAGSENVGEIPVRGEAIHINQSLSHLSNCILHLALKKKHVPYRNCNLTRILQESLGGNSHTTIIICLSPTSSQESIYSLQFAYRAKVIKNKVSVNKELCADSWKRKYVKMKGKINIFKKMFQDIGYELHRWHKGDYVPQEEWINIPDFINNSLHDNSDSIYSSSSDTSDVFDNSLCDRSDLIYSSSFDASNLVDTSIHNDSQCDTNKSSELSCSLDVKTCTQLKGETDNSIAVLHKVIHQAMQKDEIIYEYETLTSAFLTWIEQTIIVLSERDFANCLSGIRLQLQLFKKFLSVEKSQKFIERKKLENLFSTIQSQSVYLPPEGITVSDINRAWKNLEKAAHERELALRVALIRQEKLERLNLRFDQKSNKREMWLCNKFILVSQDDFNCDLSSMEASAKKHEIIENEIYAYKERIQEVVVIAQDLEAEDYPEISRIHERRDNLLRLWNHLLELLRTRRSRLDDYFVVQESVLEMANMIEENKSNFQNILSQLEQVKEKLDEKTQEVLLSDKEKSDLSANLQAEKEKVRRLTEALKCESNNHQFEIKDMNLAQANVEIKLKECLDSLHVTIEENKVKFQNILSELEKVKKELAEKKHEVLLSEKEKSDLTANLQAEKEEVKRLTEALKCESNNHQCQIKDMNLAQANVEMKFKKCLDSLHVMEIDNKRKCEKLQSELSLAKQQIVDKNELIENRRNMEPKYEAVESEMFRTCIRNEFSGNFEITCYDFIQGIRSIVNFEDIIGTMFIILIFLFVILFSNCFPSTMIA